MIAAITVSVSMAVFVPIGALFIGFVVGFLCGAGRDKSCDE